MMSSATTFLLLLATLVFFREPARPADLPPVKSMGRVLGDMARVFGDVRFMTFLVIFSGFWVMFWQIFYSLPFYVRDILHYPRFEVIETVDAWTIIFVTVPAAALARKLRPIRAMTLGFALATLSWFVMGSIPTIAGTVGAIMLFAVGESIQAPRYYEYVANLAPRDQVGTYMGFAFLPIAIGTFIAGAIAGKLVTTFVQGSATPQHMWYVVGAIGVVSTALMLAYDRFVAPRTPA
jgi:proton-dependent oligopeptide transporter, POT family